jgi:hypothetical protein
MSGVAEEKMTELANHGWAASGKSLEGTVDLDRVFLSSPTNFKGHTQHNHQNRRTSRRAW